MFTDEDLASDLVLTDSMNSNMMNSKDKDAKDKDAKDQDAKDKDSANFTYKDKEAKDKDSAGFKDKDIDDLVDVITNGAEAPLMAKEQARHVLMVSGMKEARIGAVVTEFSSPPRVTQALRGPGGAGGDLCATSS